MTKRYMSFADLQAAGIVRNRQTLMNWQRKLGFPRPFRLGPNTAAFDAEAVEAWVESREGNRDGRDAA